MCKVCTRCNYLGRGAAFVTCATAAVDLACTHLQPMQQATAERLLEAKGTYRGEAGEGLGVEGEEWPAARFVQALQLRRRQLEVGGEPTERDPHERQGGERDGCGDGSDQ